MAAVTSDPVFEALVAAGVLDTTNVRRVVIDLQVGKPALIHVEQVGADKLLDVVRHLDGVDIRYSDAEQATPCPAAQDAPATPGA